MAGIEVVDWADEREDVIKRFTEELRGVTGDGSKKRQAGLKPPWWEDKSHEGAIFSHWTKYKRGERVDPDSGRHPLAHGGWRMLAIACSENGNHPQNNAPVNMDCDWCGQAVAIGHRFCPWCGTRRKIR